HFFVAVCAHRPQVGNPTFVYVPRSANVLRERERHIAVLDDEVALKNQWLEKAKAELARLNLEHQNVLGELDRSNRWADELNLRLTDRDGRIVDLQEELAEEQSKARAKIASLEQENLEKTAWAIETDRRLTAEIDRIGAELVKAVAALEQLDKDL